MKRKTQGTFSSEITEVLAYYHGVAQRSSEPRRTEDRAARKFAPSVPPRAPDMRSPVPAR